MFARIAKTNENKDKSMKRKITESYVRKLIGKNIKRLRTLQNKSQLSLSLDAGITHNFLNDIENCKKGVSIKTLSALCAALHTEPHQFFLPEGEMKENIHVYVNDFNDSLQKLVKDLTEQYLSPSKP